MKKIWLTSNRKKAKGTARLRPLAALPLALALFLSACGGGSDGNGGEKERPGDTLFQHSIADGVAMSEGERSSFYQSTVAFYENIGASPQREESDFWEAVEGAHGQLQDDGKEIVDAKGGLMLLASENCNAHGIYDEYYQAFLDPTSLSEDELYTMTAAEYAALPIDERVAAVLAFNQSQDFVDTASYYGFLGDADPVSGTVFYQTDFMDFMLDGRINDEYKAHEAGSFAAHLGAYQDMDEGHIYDLTGISYSELFNGGGEDDDDGGFHFLYGVYYGETQDDGLISLDEEGTFALFDGEGELYILGAFTVDESGVGELYTEEGEEDSFTFVDESSFMGGGTLYTHESVFGGWYEEESPQSGDTGAYNSNEQTFNPYGTSSGNLNNGGMVASYDGWTYFHTMDVENMSGVLYRMAEGGEPQALYEGLYAYLHVDGDWLYYVAAHDDSTLRRIRADGSGEEEVLFNGQTGKISLCEGEIFFVDGIMDEIRKLNLDTMEVDRLKDTYPTHLYAVDGWVYYVDGYNGYSLWRMRTDGSEDQQLLMEDAQVEDLNVQDGWIYYRDNYRGSTMQRIDLEGENREDLTSDPAMQINVAGDYIYFTKGSEGHLYRLCIDDSVEDLLMPGPLTYICTTESQLIYMAGQELGDGDYALETVRMGLDGEEFQ